MPLRCQAYCGVRRGLFGLHWFWCKGRGPHLQVRQEPQGSSPFQTPIAGSLQTWDRRVRPRPGLRHGTPLASGGVHGVRGHLSSCIWNLGFFPDDARSSHCPFVLTSFKGWSSKRCPGIGFISRGDREIGVLRNVEPPTRPRLECRRETGLILSCDQKVGNPFQTKQGSQPSCRD